MSADPPPEPKRELTEADAERLAYDALRADGRFVPQTPEEVAAAEAEIDEPAVQLPDGLRDPLAILSAPAEPAPLTVEPSALLTKPHDNPEERPMRSTRRRWIVRSAVVVVVAAWPVYQLVALAAWSIDARAAQRTLQAKRDELARLQADQNALRTAARKEVGLDTAEQAETKLRQSLRTAHESARKAVEDKEFVVRLTGPEHVQPGAPNKWQIETLRRGAVGRPNKLDVVVKDAADKELFRQTHDKPVGAATLELPAAFWTRVPPGADLFLEVVAHVNDRATVLAERLPLGRPVYVTHLVTDKPLYKPGETVRFRSLTLDRSTLKPPSHDLHLKFRLIQPGGAIRQLDEGNGRLLADLKPVLGPEAGGGSGQPAGGGPTEWQPLRGIGVGEYPLPESAPGGEYRLDLLEASAATGKDVLLESRKFIVNRYVPDTFEKKLEFDGKSYGPGEFVQARIEVSRTAGGPMVDAKATVIASADGKPFHEQKDATFRLLTDAGGKKAVLDVRFKLPAEVFEKKDGPPSVTLSVAVRDASDAETIVRPIPLVTKTLRVDFFPEGGEMIEGVAGRVYFMVRTPDGARDLSPAKPGFTAAPGGKPADLKGSITDGTNMIADVSTLTDAANPGVNRGHGVFTLTPERGKTYYLKIATPLGITEPTPHGFPLPAAKADGVALTALDAVTPRGGAVRVRLQSPTGPKTLHVGAYVREHLVAQQKLMLEANRPADVALKGDETVGGVTRITVFEERTADDGKQTALVPRAERLTFRGPGRTLALKVTPDKSRYAPSDKVRLDLEAATEAQTPTPAVLMVGVVNRSVITMADNKTDRLAPTHFLLAGEVKNSAELEHADFLLAEHEKAGVALDLLLGTQGWRRFAEQDVAPAKDDKEDVDALLAAHGARPSAPVELLKLEERRLNAEFAPKLEVARLRTAALEAEWNARPTPLSDEVQAAAAAERSAEWQVDEARRGIRRIERRFEDVGGWLLALLGVGLVVVVGYAVYRKIVTELNGPSSERQSNPSAAIVGVIVVLVCVVAVLLPVTHMARMAKVALAPAEMADTAEREKRMSAAGGMDRAEALQDALRQRGAVTLVGNGDPRWNSQPPASGRPKGGERESAVKLQADKDRLAAAFKNPRRDAVSDEVSFVLDNTGSMKFEGEFGPLRTADGRLAIIPPARDGIPAVGYALTGPPPVPPFVVREYAHQRDPALGAVRADFTETVYWHPVLVLPRSGKATVEFQLSNDIARYQVLVAGHTLDGRIGAVTTTIEARKPFSADPKLPLEIAHTDTIDAPIRVTNDSDVGRTVTLTTTTTGLKIGSQSKSVIGLGPNDKSRATVRLTADKLDGYAGVLITAASGVDTDRIARTIRVVPDGFPGVGSFSDVLEKGRATGAVTMPKDVVPGTLKVRLEMYPTSMADLVKGLDGLLREPSGCFEQTSTTNYPNTLILDYLNQTNQANPQVAARAKALLATGYGRLTGFECPDTPLKIRQGYEWFGAADRPHLALTAYGLLQFKDMARVSPVDPAMIKRTQAFLLSQRDGKGGFRHREGDHHSFGMAPKHIVSAYVLWALVESDPDDVEKLDLKTEIAALRADALDEKSPGGKDPYFVALAANVLQLRTDREAANKLLDRLKDKHFKDGVVAGAATSVTHSGGRDLEIETTALALLGWLRANDPTYATTIKAATRWLSRQRGGYGGFGSTQSTILALKALTLYAKKNAHPAEAGTLRLLAGGKEVAARKFTQEDVDVIALEVPNAEAVFKPGERTAVEVATDAKQPYPFALAYTYTTLTPPSAPQCAVTISTKLGKAEAREGEAVPLAVTFENRLNKGHGMAVAVVGIPAGMKVPTDVKQLTDLREKGVIAYFEIRDRELILYWRELAPEQKIALTVDLVCDVPGTYRGPASRGYLYYDADHKHWVEPLAVTITP